MFTMTELSLLCFTDQGHAPQEETSSRSLLLVARWDSIPGDLPIIPTSFPINHHLKGLDNFGNVGDGERNIAIQILVPFAIVL